MSSWQRWLLHAGAFLVALSGIALGVLKYFGGSLAARFPGLFPSAQDPFSIVSHPLQPWILDLHVLAAPMLVFAVGWIFKDHVMAKLNGKGAPARKSGVLELFLLAPMILSGYLVQTTTQESLHLAAVVVHVASGLLFAVAYTVHVLLAPKRPAER